jgi:UDP-N-acetyl-2-amino-2-deoxyglucuronate dehydrogenase
VAPRHLEAIHAVGGELVAACDPHDSVGVLDRYFPRAFYFREVAALERFLAERAAAEEAVDFVTVCTPNDLHVAHAHLGLAAGADVVCEKPLALEPGDISALAARAEALGRRVFPVLQLRQHRAARALAELVLANPERRFTVELDYVTARGPWYQASWKGDPSRSGGLLLNIGVHFLDLLLWVFGELRELRVIERTPQLARGELALARADVTWRLSTDASALPPEARASGARTHRTLRVLGEQLDFSTGFEELHRRVYERLVSGEGPSARDAIPAVGLARAIERAPLSAAARGPRAPSREHDG